MNQNHETPMTHSCSSGFVQEAKGVRPCLTCAAERSAELRSRQLQTDFLRFTRSRFETYKPVSRNQQQALKTLEAQPAGSYYLVGGLQRGKTHLLVSQFRAVPAGTHCEIRTSRQLVRELQDAERRPEEEFPILQALESRKLHLFWDDIDKLSFDKTAFRAESISELIDEIWRNNLSLTVTANVEPLELQQLRGLNPATARRLADMCVRLEV